VVSTLPGFALSNPITGIIGPRGAAELMHGLMAELFGDTPFIVQGGDWGAAGAPRPFVWTANPDKIIAAVKRGTEMLESIH
jgi:hypothetical protein